jgi:EAL domain-containing protein (putative c-di-GMP-specific phosphodiesterase class I)
VHVSFNVSPSELSDRKLPERILRIALEEGTPPERLSVEMTETAIVKDNAVAHANLQAFRQAGITTALDDFGTGYASLAQLRHLPFDCVKIDRSFVTPLLTNNDCEAIVTAILGLARSLKLRVVAEGIEDQNVAAALAARGCDLGQGYYFAKPMSAGEATAMLTAGPRWLNAA